MIVDRFLKSILIGFVVTFVTMSSPCHAQTSEAIFDWGARSPGLLNGNPGIAVSPHPGHDRPADSESMTSRYDWSDTNNSTQAFMLQFDSGPVHGVVDAADDRTETLIQTLDYFALKGYMLDYVLTDYEPVGTGYTREDVEEDIEETLNLVRNHPAQNVNNARIGVYRYAPGDVYHTAPFDNSSATSYHQFYNDHPDLNVAQPVAFAYEYYRVHAGGNHFSGVDSPNKRSALFWAPLERVSLAKAGLPEGDELIPWINAFTPWATNPAPNPADFQPTAEDRVASLQHYRLRGSDGYYTLGAGGAVGLTSEQYRQDMNGAWHSLDWLFDSEQSPEILNLATNKASGLEWSGVRQENQVAFLVSNLGNSAAQVDFPDLPGVPDFSPLVSAGSHEWFLYPSIQQIVARFTSGNGIVSVNQYPGIGGNGWTGGWIVRGAIDSLSTQVGSTIPLNSGSNYLSVAKSGTGYGTIAREYADIGDVVVAEEHTIRWDYRFDGTVDDGDRVHFFGDDAAMNSTEAGNSWIIGRAETSRFGDGNWFFYDRVDGAFTEINTVDTGISLTAGTVYSFEITVNPVTGTYDATVTDGVTTFSSTDLVFRNGLNGAFPYFHAGSAAGDDTFSIDSIEISPVTSGFNADFDSDGDVDGADFLAWQRGFGIAAAGLSDGDANTDGIVNGTDLTIWEDQFGTNGEGMSAAIAVPEPGSALLLVLSMMTYATIRRRGW